MWECFLKIIGYLDIQFLQMSFTTKEVNSSDTIFKGSWSVIIFMALLALQKIPKQTRFANGCTKPSAIP